MLLTTQAIDNAIAAVQQYDGQQIAYPNGTYKGECTVPVYDYVKTLCGITPPYMANDRADGWGTLFPGALAPFFTHSAYRSGTTYPRGTLLIWNSPHIAIALSSPTGNSVEVLEQNADPDGSPLHTGSRIIDEPAHTCTYALVPIIAQPAPEAPAAPIQPPAAPLPYPSTQQAYDVLVPVPGYTTANLAANKQNSNSTVPVGSYPVFNQEYGMLNVTTKPGYPGWWINPSDNVQPVAPAPATPEPSVPLATSSNTYQIVKAIPGYTTASNAVGHSDSNSTVPAGVYNVYNQKYGMINVTHTGAAGWWINPADNVATVATAAVAATTVSQPITDVTPAPINDFRETYQSLNADSSAVLYVALKPLTVADQSGARPDIQLPQYKEIGIYGTFTKNGILYGRPRLKADTTFSDWYGIPMTDPVTHEPNLMLYADLYGTPSLNALSISDYFALALEKIKKLFS